MEDIKERMEDNKKMYTISEFSLIFYNVNCQSKDEDTLLAKSFSYRDFIELKW